MGIASLGGGGANGGNPINCKDLQCRKKTKWICSMLRVWESGGRGGSGHPIRVMKEKKEKAKKKKNPQIQPNKKE